MDEKPSQILERLEALRGPRVPVGDLLDAFADRGPAVVLFVVAIPLALPIPAPPPLNFLFGLPLLFITLQMVAGRRHLYVPGWVRRQTLPKKTLDAAADRGRRFLRWAERFVRPRLSFMTGGAARYILGAGCTLMTLSIFTIYPMSNTIPSAFIALSAFGRITGDGLIMLAGLVGGLTYVALLAGSMVLLGDFLAGMV